MTYKPDEDDYEVEEVYVDPDSGQTIVYDTDSEQHIVDDP